MGLPPDNTPPQADPILPPTQQETQDNNPGSIDKDDLATPTSKKVKVAAAWTIGVGLFLAAVFGIAKAVKKKG